MHSARKQTVGKTSAHDAAGMHPAKKWAIGKTVV